MNGAALAGVAVTLINAAVPRAAAATFAAHRRRKIV
jgi:hypothetical protein